MAYIFFSVILTLMISIYGIMYKPHVTKKIISLTIFGDVANILALLVGFRYIYPIAPPVLWTSSPTATDISKFLSVAVDPLPQALILTAIVLNMAISLFIVFVALQVYRVYGTLDSKKMAEKRRGQGEP